MHKRWDDNYEQRDWDKERPVTFWDTLITILVVVVVCVTLILSILNNINLI